MTITSEHRLLVFADYHQVHVSDAERNDEEGIGWTAEDVADMLSRGRDFVAFTTEHDSQVSVRLEIHSRKPDVVPEHWRRIAEHPIALPSGRVTVKGPTDYEPASFTTRVPSSAMIVRILWANEDPVRDVRCSGWDDHVVQMWPATADTVSTRSPDRTGSLDGD